MNVVILVKNEKFIAEIKMLLFVIFMRVALALSDGLFHILLDHSIHILVYNISLCLIILLIILLCILLFVIFMRVALALSVSIIMYTA